MKYSPENDVHRELVALGKKARESACNSLEAILKRLGLYNTLRERGYLTIQEVARLRGAIRKELSAIIQRIDDKVKSLLKVGTRNSLLDYL